MTNFGTRSYSPTQEPTSHEWAYLAGLFDGEGCIQCIPTGRYVGYNLRLTLSQVDYTPIGFIYDRLGGHVRWVERRESPRYDWGVYSRQAVRYILRGMRPYLILKADQADLVLRYKHNEALRQALIAAKKERTHARTS